MKKIYTEVKTEILFLDDADILTASGISLASSFDYLNEDKAGYTDLF